MLSFIVAVLIIGALLSAIFGKTVGTLFTLGTYVLVGGSVVVIALIAVFFFLIEPDSPRHTSDTSQPYVSQPAATGVSVAAPAAAPAPIYTAAPVYNAAPVSRGPAPSNYVPHQNSAAVAPAETNMQIGVSDGQSPPPEDVTFLTVNCHIPVGIGDYVTYVEPGSPAEMAGICNSDILVSAQVIGTRRIYLGPQYSLHDFEQAYLSASGPKPISLHVFRLSNRHDFYVYVTPIL